MTKFRRENQIPYYLAAVVLDVICDFGVTEETKILARSKTYFTNASKGIWVTKELPTPLEQAIADLKITEIELNNHLMKLNLGVEKLFETVLPPFLAEAGIKRFQTPLIQNPYKNQ